jgi:hypothetical protein
MLQKKFLKKNFCNDMYSCSHFVIFSVFIVFEKFGSLTLKFIEIYLQRCIISVYLLAHGATNLTFLESLNLFHLTLDLECKY